MAQLSLKIGKLYKDKLRAYSLASGKTMTRLIKEWLNAEESKTK